MNEKEREFEAEIRRILDDDVARLDGETRARLRHARSDALAATSQGRAVYGWLPVGGVALIALVAVVFWWQHREIAAPPIAPSDFELLTSKESLELYKDLDFYQWLEHEADHAG